MIFRKLITDEDGATAVEYGLMVALIAVVIITVLSLLGSNTEEKFSLVGETIRTAS